MILRTFASVAVLLLLIILLALRMLLRRFHKVSGLSAAARREEGFLPYPLYPVEGNPRSEKAAARYNGAAKLGMAIMIISLIIPVLLSMISYFQR